MSDRFSKDPWVSPVAIATVFSTKYNPEILYAVRFASGITGQGRAPHPCGAPRVSAACAPPSCGSRRAFAAAAAPKNVSKRLPRAASFFVFKHR